MEQEWAEILGYIKQILNFSLFELNNTPVTLMSFVIFLIFMGGFVFMSSLLHRFLLKRVLSRFQIDHGMRYTLAQMSKYTVMVIGVLISFQFLGIDLSSLAVIFGLLSVGIGFGLQNLTSNFISGLIVLFERPISVGDRVMVNNIEGDVTEINIRATKVRTVNNISIIVPNSEFVSKDVINYSHGDPSYRLDINVGVSYRSDLDVVLKAMREVADENKSVMSHPKPDVHLINFGDSAWDMQLRAWISDVTEYPRVKNELNQAIVRKFRERSIEIPFPQRDLHVRSSVSIPTQPEKNHPNQ